MPQIRSDRLLLREWKRGDREPFARINADPRVMEFFPACLSREESDSLADRIDLHFARHGFGLFAVELQNGCFAGFTGLAIPSFAAPIMPCVEIGWRLGAEFWGQGLATEAAAAVANWAFLTLGLLELVSFTVPANTRSIRVMEKIGMRRDRGADFDHPGLPPGHALRRHVLYRIASPGSGAELARPG